MIRNNEIKIGSFTNELTPWQWTPPEYQTIDHGHQFDKIDYGKLDIYSFGCVIFEILRLGEQPFQETYPISSNDEFLKDVQVKQEVSLWKDKNGAKIEPKLLIDHLNIDLSQDKMNRYADLESQAYKIFIRDLISLSTSCISFEPNSRPKFKDIVTIMQQYQKPSYTIEDTDDTYSTSTSSSDSTLGNYLGPNQDRNNPDAALGTPIDSER